MDGQRFDELTRALAAGGTSRRAVVKGLLGSAVGALGGLAGLRWSAAQTCRSAGRLCVQDATCCSGLCDTTNPDPFKRNRCACPPGTVNCRGACLAATADFLSDVLNCGGCGVRCPIDQCNQATCTNGVCGLEPNLDRIGNACDDNNRCTINDVCVANGSCAGTSVVCTPPSQCHTAACNPDTGGCVQTPLTGPPCNADNSLCTQNDTCQSGSCVAGLPVVCPTPDQCHDPGTCTPQTGVCSNPAKQNGTPCNADNSLCTQNDTCQEGLCVPGTPVVCTPLDQCHVAGTCNPTTGACSNPNAPDGIACTGGSCCGGACVDTQTDERNCGGCGVRCRVNETCTGGQCLCGPSACVPGFVCGICPQFPVGLACFGCSTQGGGFCDPNQCESFGSCPGGTTPCTGTAPNCVGTPCQSCCPSGSTCDTVNGTCLQ